MNGYGGFFLEDISQIIPNGSDREEWLSLFNITDDDLDYFSDFINKNPVNGTPRPDKAEADLELLYCGDGLIDFRNSYKEIHGYISLLVCTFGCISNILNIAVLTRKEMRSGTNVILTGLALADMAVMVEYVPFTLRYYLFTNSLHDPASYWSYKWAVFIMFHANYSQIFHTIAICLNVTLAVWRYISLAYPQNNKVWCSISRASFTVLGVYILSPLICIPVFLSFSINVDYNLTSPNNETYHKYYMHISAMAEENDLVRLNFLTYSVIIKLIPCVILTIFSIFLVMKLMEAKKRRMKLLQRQKKPQSQAAANRNKADRHADQTTRMLLAVLLLFLITELPQGILGLLSEILGDQFFQNCYQNCAEIMDMAALSCGAINFMIYCLMSSQFRSTFGKLFKITAVGDYFSKMYRNPPQNENNVSKPNQVVTIV